ncbi:M13 family metallopeptidase [Pseudoduganella sp. RAF53_2]|uniref:M13 family metallopeptidase n=1 Tax=Pseudoduganella sp. RAF53_2 TaxID=3233060 RepID=UPI003F94D371
MFCIALALPLPGLCAPAPGDCVRSAPAPAFNAKQPGIRSYRFSPVSDHEAREYLALTTGESVDIRHGGCEYLVTTLRIKSKSIPIRLTAGRDAFLTAANLLRRLRQLKDTSGFDLALAANTLSAAAKGNPAFEEPLAVEGDGTDFLQAQVASGRCWPGIRRRLCTNYAFQRTAVIPFNHCKGCPMIRPALRLVFCLASLFPLSTLAADAAPAKPVYGNWGFDLDGADLSTSPGKDFFRYANGRWLDRAQIPADKPGISLRLAISDLTEKRLHELLEQSAAQVSGQPATLETKAGAFYASFMNAGRIEQLGIQPVAADLAAVKQATSRDALAARMGHSQTGFETPLFNFLIDVDLKDVNHYALYLTQAGLGLPDRDYYLQAAFARQKAAYQRYVAEILRRLNWPQPEARARDVVTFETELARVSWTKAQQRDTVATYNAMTIEQLQALAPGFNWRGMFAAAGMPQLSKVIVAEKSAFPQMARLYSRTPLATLQAWQAFHIGDNAAPYLPQAFVDAHFQLHGVTLAGLQQQPVRWKRAVTAVSGDDFLAGDRFGSVGTMGFGVGQLYTARYFPPEVKTQIEAMVLNLKAAYRARIERLDWMSEATRKEALRKLDTYVIKVGYPDHPRDYSALVIAADDLIGNVRRCAEADWAFYSGRYAGPVDRSDWAMTPQTNDAYNGSLRDIVFPAAILQAPIFDPNADPAINYGAAGGVIGHELTHGFDDEGRTIDADGALRDWWTAQDAAAFKARAHMLGLEYAKLEPVPGAKVNAELTMGENIADLGGVTLALDAYHASLNGQPAPLLDGYTGDQRVFLGWAQAWRGKVREEAVRKQLATDPHSPRQYRGGIPPRNVDAWYEAFQVQPGDPMYLPPEQRARIW